MPLLRYHTSDVCRYVIYIFLNVRHFQFRYVVHRESEIIYKLLREFPFRQSCNNALHQTSRIVIRQRCVLVIEFDSYIDARAPGKYSFVGLNYNYSFSFVRQTRLTPLKPKRHRQCRRTRPEGDVAKSGGDVAKPEK